MDSHTEIADYSKNDTARDSAGHSPDQTADHFADHMADHLGETTGDHFAADTAALHRVSDDDLLRRLAHLVRDSRRTEADLVAHIGEVDHRRLYARFAVPSMFSYCTELLHLSEAEAYLRITAARASRRHPVLLRMLGDGRLHLSAIALLAPRLTAENRETLLTRAAHRSKRQIQELLAELDPRPDVPTTMRRLPQRLAVGVALPSIDGASLATRQAGAVGDATVVTPSASVPCISSQLRPDGVAQRRAGVSAVLVPIAPRRYRVEFTASEELRDKLQRLQALMRSAVPDGDLAEVIEAAVTEKLQRLEARRYGTTSKPRKTRKSELRNRLAGGESTSPTRHIPAAVRRAVHARDEGRCRYVDEQGRRCAERHELDFHHRRPFGFGGGHDVENVALLCRAHNGHLARVDFGPGLRSCAEVNPRAGDASAAPPGRSHRRLTGSSREPIFP